MADFTYQAMLDFLDFTRRKGLANGATVMSRRATLNSVSEALTDEEKADVRKIVAEDVIAKFSHLRGSDFKPESMRVYQARLKNSIKDFLRYREDPIGFKPKPLGKAKTRKPSAAAPQSTPAAQPAQETPATTTAVSEITFPIPLRPDVVIRLIGVPSDLTKKEAMRIANVITALAQDPSE